MSQENTVQSTATLPAQPVTTVDSTTMVTTYADSLMAGLFEDIDRLLEGDEAALAALEAPESPESPESLESEAGSEAPGDDSEDTSPAATATMEAPTAALATPESPAIAPYQAPPPKTSLGKWLDRLLLTSAVVSLLGAIAFLIFNQQRSGVEVAVLEPTQGQTDAEFLAYLQRSLDVVARRSEQRSSEESALNIPPDVALVPTNPGLMPNGDGAFPGGRINVIERVYIPYQTAPATPPAVSPESQPSAGAPPLVPLPLPQGTLPQPNTTVPTPPSQPATPGVTHVLVGVLELGDRSAALFEVNGVSQRVSIGERIGSAGWSLVSVANQEVVIRRNGEVRSIYIGQRF